MVDTENVSTMPKLKTLQIVWHGKEPVYSLDFHPNGLLVTAGADKEIKTWKVRRRQLCFSCVSGK